MNKLFGRLAGCAAGADADLGSCRSAKQGHGRDRRRRLPVLSADRAGQATRRIREGRRSRVELVDLKGGSDALKAVLGGSADVVSGYFDHCVNLAAKKQELQSFVVYDRYPGLVLVVSPKHTDAHQVDQGSGRQEGRRQRAGFLDRFLPEVSPEEERRRSDQRRGDRRRPRCHGRRGDAAGTDRGGRDARSVRDGAAGQLSGSEDPRRHPHAEGHARRVRRRVSGRRALHHHGLDQVA